MKKSFRYIVFASIMTCSFSLSSCSSGGSGNQDNKFVGVHQYTATETNNYLVKDGKTDYIVVIPEDASDKERLAREEFCYFFKAATNLEIKYVQDNEVNINSVDKYISIGNTELLTKNSLSVDYKEYGEEGVRIVTKSNNIFLFGARDSGTVYAVYDFMTITFNYSQYAPDYFEIDNDVKNKKLLNYDVKDIPDIPMRANGFGYFRGGSTNYDYAHYGYRMRMEKERGYHFMPIFRLYDYSSQSVTSTNTNTYVPYDVWSTTHPKWFSNKCSTGKYQLCYTARGDHNERELLVHEVAHKIEFSLMRYNPIEFPQMNVATFTMEDNFNTCECEECNRLSEYYGAQSGPLNLFVNDVGVEVEAWMKDPENAAYKRDDFHIIYFAYNAYEPAPAKYNEEKKCWEPTHPEVKLRSNVGVYFAEINIIDYQKSLFAESNKGGKDAFDAWEAISDFMYYWTYETNFAYLMYFYDTFDFYTQEMYNYVASKKIDMFFGEGQEFCSNNGINFNALKGYLDSKLAWDSTLNQQELMNDYFKAMYGDASHEMRDFFDLIRAHNAELIKKVPDLDTLRSCYNLVRDPSYYPLTTLESFVSKVDHALGIISKIKETNIELYNKLYAHIEAEAVSYLYIMLDLHKNELTYDRKTEVLDRLYYDVELLSIENMQIREGGSTLISILDGFRKSI